MATQEERLTTLERKTAASIRELNENLTMTIGLLKTQSFSTKKIDSDIKNIRETLDIRFDATNVHLELLQQHADKTDKKLNLLDARLDSIETQLSEQKTLLAEILARLPEKV